jgi:hypothetical protein
VSTRSYISIAVCIRSGVGGVFPAAAAAAELPHDRRPRAGVCAYLAGFTGSATVGARQLFEIAVFGTMAHSFVQIRPASAVWPKPLFTRA